MKIVKPIKDLDKIEEFKIVLRHRSYRDYFMFVLGINCPLRITDILELQVKDIINKTHIDLTENKTGKDQSLLILPILQKEIDLYTQGMNPDDYLFTKSDGTPIGRVRAYRILNNAAEKIGLNHIRIGCHTLRKTFGYHFYQRTHDIVLLKKILNHSSIEITMRYIDLDQDMKDEAMRKFKGL